MKDFALNRIILSVKARTINVENDSKFTILPKESVPIDCFIDYCNRLSIFIDHFCTMEIRKCIAQNNFEKPKNW